MSHPLRTLAGYLPALAEYECAQIEMRHGIAACQAGDLDSAATEFDSAARSADRLARMATEHDPAQAKRWRDVATQRRDLAEQARVHIAGWAVKSV